MNTDLINEISQIVETACRTSANKFGDGMWTHHIQPMIGIVQSLAERRSADLEIVTLAVLLHDLAGVQDPAKVEEHHVHGAAEADRLLSERDYPIERIQIIKDCILSHRGSVPREKSTPEAVCVADADAIVHITGSAALLFVAYSKLGMGVDEGRRWVSEKLKRDWAKLSPDGRDVVRKEFDAAQLSLSDGSGLLDHSGDPTPSS